MDRFRLRSVGWAHCDLVKAGDNLRAAVENMQTACDYPEDGKPPAGGRDVIVAVYDVLEALDTAKGMLGDLK